MKSRKLITTIAAGALTGCLFLMGCGSTQEAASSTTESAPAAEESAPAASENASGSSETTSTDSKATDTAAAPSDAAAAPSDAASADSYIGEQAAIDAALKDAGFAASDVTELEAELDLDDAVVHYDVEFKQGGMEYSYDVDAVSGAIIASESEVDD